MKHVLAGIILLLSLPAMGEEFNCVVNGTNYGGWQGKTLEIGAMDQKLHAAYQLRLTTGQNPKIGYYFHDDKQWIWYNLSAIQTKKGTLYYGTPADGGIITAKLSKDNIKVIVNYVYGKEDKINTQKMTSETEFAECSKAS